MRHIASTFNPPYTSEKTKAAKKPTEPQLVDLSDAEVRALAKPRTGYEKHVEALLVLAQGNLALQPKGFKADDLRDALRTAQSLEESRRLTAKHLEMLEETQLLHSSKVWKAMLDIYARGQAVGRTDSAVASALDDFARFMKTGPRKKTL